jgi:hypothetical protein
MQLRQPNSSGGEGWDFAPQDRSALRPQRVSHGARSAREPREAPPHLADKTGAAAAHPTAPVAPAESPAIAIAGDGGPAESREAMGQPITRPDDPRWLLALRVSESLEGPILTHEKRERLLRLGKLLGLSAFDSNLVIAIVQDRARRGHAPDRCPFEARGQLAMVPAPGQDFAQWIARFRRTLIVAGVIAAAIGVELIGAWWALRGNV